MKIQDIPVTKQSLKTRGIAGNTQLWVKQMAQRDMKLWGMDQPLWIIDNKIYDLRQFMSKHPGGPSWLQLTKGQDISVLYKTHHLQPQLTSQMLHKYYIKDTPIVHPQRFQFTNKQHYNKIRQMILSKYTVQQLHDSSKTQIRCYIIIVIWIILYTLCGVLESYLLAMMCGCIFMGFYGIGHIFAHKGDRGNWLKHVFLMIGFSAREQQVIHAISHHPYPNTMLDYQFSGMQPVIQLARCQPTATWYHRLLSQLFVFFTGPGNALNKLIFGPLTGKQKFSLQHSVALLQIVYLSLFTTSISTAVKLWSTMFLIYGFLVGKMLLCSHRQPQLWSQGNPQIKDYVQHIICTTTDTNHTKIPKILSILIYSSFDLHIIHHLFPTIDHNMLQECQQIFMEFCKENKLYGKVNGSMFQCNRKMWELQRERKKFCLQQFVCGEEGESEIENRESSRKTN